MRREGRKGWAGGRKGCSYLVPVRALKWRRRGGLRPPHASFLARPPTPLHPPHPHPDPATFGRLQDLSESDFDDADSDDARASSPPQQPAPPPRRAVVGTPADLAAQVDAWLAGRPSPTSAALACSVCAGVLLVGPAAARNHVASKKHVKACAAASVASPSAPLKYAAAPDDMETHAERAERVNAAAVAAAKAKAARSTPKKATADGKAKRSRGARRPGKRPGKRQRALLKGGKEA